MAAVFIFVKKGNILNIGGIMSPQKREKQKGGLFSCLCT